MTRFVNTLFAASAFSVTFLLLAVFKYWDKPDLFDFEFLTYIFLFILLSFLSWLIVLGIRAMGETMYIENIKKIESKDNAVVPFIASFSAPSLLKIFDFDFSIIRIAFIAIVIFGFIVSYVPVHPILRIIGFHFYKAETDDGIVFTLVTNRAIRNKDSIREVIRVSENLYFEGNTK